jgi:integrase
VGHLGKRSVGACRLTAEEIIRRNPARRNGQRIISRPKLQNAAENDNVISVSGDEVRRLLDVASAWNERLAVHLLAYLGPRRKALAIARLSDYDRDERTISFSEKGSKRIAKPVPDRLAAVLDAAILAGVYEHETDYLVPGRAIQRRPGDRDDRVIWHLVRAVAARAGVTTHVHALRAAFAVHYLETHPGQIEALQKLMGHKRLETTLVYLRRLQRRQQMETVRDLDWGNGSGEIRTREPGVDPSYPLSRRALSATQAPIQIAEKLMEAKPVFVPVDLQPSFEPLRLLDRAGRQHASPAPGKEPEGAVQGPG